MGVMGAAFFECKGSLHLQGKDLVYGHEVSTPANPDQLQVRCFPGRQDRYA